MKPFTHEDILDARDQALDTGDESPNVNTETDDAQLAVKGKGMTDRLLFAWVNGKPAPNDMQFPDKS